MVKPNVKQSHCKNWFSNFVLNFFIILPSFFKVSLHPPPKKRISYNSSVLLLYTGLVSPRVIFASLHLHTVSLRLEFAQLCLQIDVRDIVICSLTNSPLSTMAKRAKIKRQRIFPCIQYMFDFINDYISSLSGFFENVFPNSLFRCVGVGAIA